jgi:hypothetical protein
MRLVYSFLFQALFPRGLKARRLAHDGQSRYGTRSYRNPHFGDRRDRSCVPEKQGEIIHISNREKSYSVSKKSIPILDILFGMSLQFLFYLVYRELIRSAIR